MRSASDRGRAAARAVIVARRALVGALLLVAAASPARATPMSFQLTVGDVLGSVDRYNGFLVSLGKSAPHVKLIPGGTVFAGQSCAAFGSVFALGSVAVLDGTSTLALRAPSKKNKFAALLTPVFNAAAITTWTPPALGADTDVPLWSAGNVSDGIYFVSHAVSLGNGDDGLLGADADPTRVLRFSIDVTGLPDVNGRYRFFLELYGQTPSTDGALVAAGQRTCFTFVDLAPVDYPTFDAWIHVTVTDARLLNTILEPRLGTVATALDQHNTPGAIAGLAHIVQATVLNTPGMISTLKSRALVEFAGRVRHGLLFSPNEAHCGNNIRETGEDCDGTDLGGFDCTSVGLSSGTLSCTADCRLDTSQCIASHVCGNGILEPGEECDNGANNSDTVPDACRTNCKLAYCGDGVVDSYEDCEGHNLDGETCVSLGYTGGTLSCDSDCQFDDQRCND